MSLPSVAKNLCAGTERVRMAPRRKTVTDRGHLKQGVGSVLFYSVINVSVGNGTLWRRLGDKFYGVKLSSYLPAIPKLWALSIYSGLCCLLKDQLRLVWKGIFITHCRKLCDTSELLHPCMGWASNSQEHPYPDRHVISDIFHDTSPGCLSNIKFFKTPWPTFIVRRSGVNAKSFRKG